MTNAEIIKDLKERGGQAVNILLEFREKLVKEMNLINEQREYYGKLYFNATKRDEKEYYSRAMLDESYKLATALRITEMYDAIAKARGYDLQELYEGIYD